MDKPKCDVCGTREVGLDRYEITTFFINKDVKYESIICDDCIKSIQRHQKISNTVPCERCGEEVSEYRLHRVPILANRDDYDIAYYCTECFHRAEENACHIESSQEEWRAE